MELSGHQVPQAEVHGKIGGSTPVFGCVCLRAPPISRPFPRSFSLHVKLLLPVFMKATPSSCRTRQSVDSTSPDPVLSPLSHAAAPGPTATILSLTLGFPSPRINRLSMKRSLASISLSPLHQVFSTTSHPITYLVAASRLPEPRGAGAQPHWPSALGIDGVSYPAPWRGSYCRIVLGL